MNVMAKYANICHPVSAGDSNKMATLNVSMPDSMREWINAQIEAGEYANASDYLRDLIRHDQRERDRVRMALIEGELSGLGERSIADIRRQSKRKLKRA